MKTITIEIPEGKKAKWVDGVLTLVDDKPKDITERIKTFEDACEWCKENGKQGLYEQYADALNVGLQRSPDIIAYLNQGLYEQYADALNVGLQRAKDILAYLKLRIITAALNEGWEPTFNGEKRYVVAIDYKYEMSVTYECNFAMIPKKLVYKTYELAEYAATQFKDIYMDFCYKGKE